MPVSAAWSRQKVLLAVTGGIACYKSASLASQIVQAGSELRVLMTRSAVRFVAPLTFQTLSGRPVITSIWQPQESYDSEHVSVARWATLVVVAPCTANTLAKLATGLADDVVSLTLSALPRATPVLLAPAMNAQMWENPVTQRNLATVRDLLGYRVVGPEEGWQACRTVGLGRMSEPQAIFAAAEALL